MNAATRRPPLAPIAPIPEEFASRYRAQGYYTEQTFPDFIRQVLESYGDRTAAVGLSTRRTYPTSSTDTVSWTYRELGEQAHLAAHHLRSLGVLPGDRVLLQLPNTLEYLSYTLGVFLAGALPIFALPKHRARDLAHFAGSTDAAAHVFAQGAEQTDYRQIYRDYSQQLTDQGKTPPVAVDVTQALPNTLPDSWVYDTPIADRSAPVLSENTALFQLSGGTTGLSKLIPRTHADYLYSVRASADICEVSGETVNLVVLPAAHNFTMSSPGILGSFYRGATLVFAHDPSPQTSFELIKTHGVTQVSLVPPLVQSWLTLATRRPLELPSLKVIQVGGAKLAPSVAERIGPVLGATLQQVAGMAEGLVNYTRLDDDPATICTTQGRPISSDDELLVVDTQGAEVEAGLAGELLTRGPYTIRAYYGAQTANRTSFTEDGFYRTGDLVIRHPDGNIEMVGRIKDQINRAGEKIATDELEDLALGLEGVQDAIAVGLPDSQLGEKIGLVLVGQLVPPAGQQALAWVRSELRQRGLSDFKLPDRVFILEKLPLTTVGKISRKDLRAQLAREFSDS
ncbi:MAG TPA: AMP-binding protein [Candidatus Rothia avicola]|uniref:AMP-binding protein n=1 Tax=Candidatus Rothia avicola TaxID=2840478 RepID=A0A9D1ZT37_9MICC|nr:AMP-binding protein [Candidatus Rothia avicola]